MNEIDPPVHNRQAEDPEMEQWAYEASSAIEAADKATKSTLERYREAGEALTKAKKKAGHGNWLPWLRRHGISSTTAGIAIRVFGSWSKLTATVNLTEAMKLMANSPEETELAPPAESNFCDRCTRTGFPRPNCEDCAAKRKSNSHKPKPPQERTIGGDAEAAKADRQRKREHNKVNGAPTFEWKPVSQATSLWIQSVDRLGVAYGAKEAPRAEELRKRAYDLKQDFRAWFKEVTGQEPPHDRDDA